LIGYAQLILTLECIFGAIDKQTHSQADKTAGVILFLTN